MEDTVRTKFSYYEITNDSHTGYQNGSVDKIPSKSRENVVRGYKSL